MSHHQNITRIKAVYHALGDLGKKVLFVGGATVSLYSDRPASESRPTDDVDILIELISYSGYADVEESLRKRGFVHDIDSGIICRFKVQGIIVDVMPTEGDVLGFSNRWYPEGFANSMEKDLGNNCIIKLFQPTYFIASKLEAFKGRGGGDGRTSSDFEDIVYILNNRTTIWNEMQTATIGVKEYLQYQFKKLLTKDHVYEWVSAHLDYSEQRRVDIIVNGIKQFILK